MIAHEVCPHLGGAAAECEDWVQHLGPLIVQSLLSELDPDTLCNELNLCGTEILARIFVCIPLTSTLQHELLFCLLIFLDNKVNRY